MPRLILFSLCMLCLSIGPVHAINMPQSSPWRASCSTDEMTDNKECTVKKTHYFNVGGERQYIVVSANRNSVYVMPKSIHPTQSVQLRIDNNAMRESKKHTQGVAIFSGGKSIINELKRGNNLKIRYYDWPKGYSRTVDISLSGFTAAYNQAF